MRIPAFFVALGLVAGSAPLLMTEASAQRQVSSETVVCESVNRQRVECPVRGRIESARPTATFSGSPCIQGYSWGYERRNIWVDQGCYASFEVELSRRGGNNNANQGSSAESNTVTETVDCLSRRFGREECRVEGRIQDVEAVGSLGGVPCRFGSSWGYENRYVWVDQGCQARFNVTYTLRDSPQPQPVPTPVPEPEDTAENSDGLNLRTSGNSLSGAPNEAIVAQGACSGQYTGSRGAYIFAVPRRCEKGAPDCNEICANMAGSIQNRSLRRLIRSKNPSCFDSVHVYDDGPGNAPGQAGTMTFVYDACGGGCGPNYCCCSAQ